MTFRSVAIPVLWGLLLALTPLGALGRSEGSIQKTWDYPEGIRSLVVDADSQDVVLRSGAPRLSGRLVGDSGDSVKLVRDGDALTVTIRSHRSWLDWRRKSSRVEITLPPGLSLDIGTASGAVLVEVATDALRVRSASGDIEASRGGKTVDVDSASGTVRLKGFHGPIKASSLSGNLLLEDLTGAIQAATLSGDLRGTDLKPEAGSRFSTVSGEANLVLSEGADSYGIHAESVSGEIKIGNKTAPDELSTGSGTDLVVKSVSGDIRIR